jgi:N-acetylglucosaminyl-diphospho-decaprenol L-rhamnosyltransferase
MAEAAPTVVTLARGRWRHLERQAGAVTRLDPAPGGYVVVSMDAEAPELSGARIVHLPVGDGEPLPLAAARNAGIEAAAEAGAEEVVCIDADCLPESGMLGALAAARRGLGAGWLLAGPVGRLAPLPADAAAPDEAALAASRRRAEIGPRPVPPPGEVLPESRYELFWSLSFAVTVADHRRIGGFDPAYVGYGAEDTDYGRRAEAAGVGFAWVGGAWAHHQDHPVSDPPIEHLADIVRNARYFRRRWGSWPMEGWLEKFAAMGAVDWDPDGERLELLDGAVAQRG